MRKLFFLSLVLGVCVTGLTFAQDDAAAPQTAEPAAAETAAENADADAANPAVEIAEPAAEAAEGGEEFAPPPRTAPASYAPRPSPSSSARRVR